MSLTRSGRVWISPGPGLLGEVLEAARRSVMLGSAGGWGFAPASCPSRRPASIQVQQGADAARVLRPARGRLEIGDGVGLEFGIDVGARLFAETGVGGK